MNGTAVTISKRRHQLLWPDELLKVASILETGWRPSALRQFVLKVHSRCNLACDYCYMYEMADQSWQSKPLRMARETVIATASRIAEHAEHHGLSSVRVVLHGGEPLLAGIDFLRHAITTLRQQLSTDIALDVSLQTNGLLLDESYLRLFDEFDVGVGVSLDGDRKANDRHRRTVRGKSSYVGVEKGLHLLTGDNFRHLFRGLLCTVDVENDPRQTYESLLVFEPPSVDFLLPHGNWTDAPPKRNPRSSDVPYADWLIAVFDRWYSAALRETNIRYFNNIMRLVLGGQSAVESIGTSRVCLAVVDTNGSIEQVDALKSAFEGAVATGLTVFDHAFDDVLAHPAIVARQLGSDGLCNACRSCPVGEICGGGYYPHRYDAANGFLNPSVYCRDLLQLVTHIRNSVMTDMHNALVRPEA